MSPLVAYEEQRDFLELPDDDDMELVESLLQSVTALFEKECGRDTAPFAPAQTGRIEIHEASSASTVLTLDYPIAAVTSIVLGRDVALPDETLSPADATKVVWRVGSRDLIRTDGGVWRRFYPRYVKVVYNTQDDLPADAKLAIQRRVATIYQHRGKEGYASVTRGSRSWTVAAGDGAQDPIWQSALLNQVRAWVR